MARFYALSIEPTLFGETRLVRRWGRINTFGHVVQHCFEEEQQAITLFLRLLRLKRHRGYKPLSAQMQLASIGSKAGTLPRQVGMAINELSLLRH